MKNNRSAIERVKTQLRKSYPDFASHSTLGIALLELARDETTQLLDMAFTLQKRVQLSEGDDESEPV